MAELIAGRHHARDPYGVILLVLALAALVVGLAMLVAGHKPAPRLSGDPGGPDAQVVTLTRA